MTAIMSFLFVEDVLLLVRPEPAETFPKQVSEMIEGISKPREKIGYFELP
jgi:hypothetical protein